MSSYYILNGHNVEGCEDVLEWAKRFEDSDARIVAKTEIGDKQVSTVFLGIDHQFGNGPALLFETMVFPDCEEMRRYPTWEEAETGHKSVCEELVTA